MERNNNNHIENEVLQIDYLLDLVKELKSQTLGGYIKSTGEIVEDSPYQKKLEEFSEAFSYRFNMKVGPYIDVLVNAYGEDYQEALKDEEFIQNKADYETLRAIVTCIIRFEKGSYVFGSFISDYIQNGIIELILNRMKELKLAE